MKATKDVLSRRRKNNKYSTHSTTKVKTPVDQEMPLDEYLQSNYNQRLQTGFQLLNGHQLDEPIEYPF